MFCDWFKTYTTYVTYHMQRKPTGARQHGIYLLTRQWNQKFADAVMTFPNVAQHMLSKECSVKVQRLDELMA